MAKITLGNRPINFKSAVTFELLDGTKGEIGMVYKYRTKREFGALIDKTFAPINEPKQIDAEDGQASLDAIPEPVSAATVSDAVDQGIKANVEYILTIADGWDLPDPFDSQHIDQLGDEQPAALLAIMAKYRVAITEGRLGN